MDAKVNDLFQYPSPNPLVTLVCLPGMGRTGAMYKPKWFSNVAKCGVRVLVVTYANSSLEDMNALGETTWDALDAFGIKSPVVLLGYSMGGFVMQTMVHQRPGSVAALVFVSTSIPNLETFTTTHMQDNMMPSAGQYLKYIKPMTKTDDLLSTKLSAENFRRESVAIIAYIVSNLASLYIKDVRCPVLIVYGVRDAIIPNLATLELKRALDGVPLTIHALDASHFVFVEKSDEVEDAILRWLKETFSSLVC